MAQLVPADLRHLEHAAIRPHHVCGKAHHAPRDDAQSGVPPHFLALVEQHLHADTDAQQRRPRVDRGVQGRSW